MGLHAHGNRPAIFGDINITPLTDIFLVLLIIMMVVAPMIDESNASITLPKIASGTHTDQNRMTVEVTSDGQFFVKGKTTEASQLTQILKDALPGLEEKNVAIRADKATKSGVVLKVLEAARDAGYEKVTVSGEALTDTRQNELLEKNKPNG